MAEADTQYRAGRYVRQASHYSAFVPEPLPPTPPLKWDSELQTLLSKADRALGRLDGSIQTLPDPDLFVFMYVRKEAVLSSQIEGTQSSLNDLLEAEAAISDSHRPSDVGEVLNYVNAMNHGLARLPELPISTRLIREIHEKLLAGVRGKRMSPGEIRRSQNWIGPGGSSLNNAVFVPPPPHEVERLLSDLEKFIHSEEFIPPLVKIGLVHAQFETIHPFLDGNGRIGRLLITFFLCQNEILQKPVLYLSHYFKEHRQLYYELLQKVRDEGAWEEWIKFFLQGVATVSLEATETARAIVGLREAHRSIITDTFGRAAGNGLRILEGLYKRPYVTVSQIRDRLEISFPPASELVRRFVEADILVEVTGRERYRIYQYTPYIHLFSDPERRPI
ncbi:Fic family protein [Allosphingosinicella sp.]|uniref:Fic family protein n=1 Tax=Allosphingosinicella sp. TaxID=2823234 RepID=UPI002FC1B7D7